MKYNNLSNLNFLTEVGWRLSSRYRRCARDGIVVSAHLCRTSTVQCGTHTVFCRTRRRARPLAIPTYVFSFCFQPFGILHQWAKKFK